MGIQNYASEQGCGAGIQISGSGSSSGRLIFWLRLQHLELFGTGSGSKTIWFERQKKTLYYLYTSLSLEPEPELQAPAPQSKNFRFRLQPSKLLGLRLHSPASEYLVFMLMRTSVHQNKKLMLKIQCLPGVRILLQYLRW